MPEELVAALKPEYVAGVVGWLVHEEQPDSGLVIECGAGYAAAVRRERAEGWSGQLEHLTDEAVRAGLQQAQDYSRPAYPTSPADSTTAVMAKLQQAKL